MDTREVHVFVPAQECIAYKLRSVSVTRKRVHQQLLK